MFSSWKIIQKNAVKLAQSLEVTLDPKTEDREHACIYSCKCLDKIQQNAKET